MKRIKLIDLIGARKSVDYMIMWLLQTSMLLFITILCYHYNSCGRLCVSFIFSFGGEIVTVIVVTLLSLDTSIFGWGEYIAVTSSDLHRSMQVF